ncbi:late endosomal/lysosomal adaptor and MAPK and MTOR activator-domain-containing protein [Xylariaceae sp. FL0594]|nr:late endosomal/lysosomal adaptor and MAPK and MTOR activator-domain-containing protein [Xylariaceae sp. FL0594]
MGICASCLGRRPSDSLDEDEVSRLLFDDPTHMQYGSFAEHNLNSQADPLESQREVEALQRVVARTSNNLVDVFEITPQEPQMTHAAVFSGNDARLTRYQNILSKLSSNDGSAEGNHGAVEWLLSDEDNAELPEHNITIKEGSAGPLIGTFADAAAVAA